MQNNLHIEREGLNNGKFKAHVALNFLLVLHLLFFINEVILL